MSEHTESQLKVLEGDAAAAGVCIYTPPSQVTPDMIDPMLRDIVARINQSGWVITCESCQGHPGAEADYEHTAWPHNDRPYLRLACGVEDAGRLAEHLCGAVNGVAYTSPGKFTSSDGAVHSFDQPGVLIVQWWPEVHADWFEAKTYIGHGGSVEARDAGIEALRSFAEAVNV